MKSCQKNENPDFSRTQMEKETIFRKLRACGGRITAARKYAKRGDPEQTQTAGLQDHKAADAVTRYHTGRRVFQL